MKAFPSLYVHFNKTTEMSEPRLVANSHDGMDLRDYFAAQIMPKMNWVNVELSAQESYRVADAMMKAREQ